MKLLLDTHMLLWSFSDDPMLSGKAVALIEDEDNVIYYSAASVWEIAIKHLHHPDRIMISPKRFLEYCRLSGFFPIPIKDEHILNIDSLDRPEGMVHNDPFDQMLIAQAKSEGMKLVTHDGLIAKYSEDCIIHV